MGFGASLVRFLGFRREELPPASLLLSAAPSLDVSPYEVERSAKPKPMPKAGRQYTPARDTWVEHPGFGLVPRRLIQIFRDAEVGFTASQCALFDDQLEADAHVRSLFATRETAVYGKPMILQADGADEESKLATRVLTGALDRMPLQHGLKAMIQHQLGANKYGFALTEIEWGVIEEGGRQWVVPTAFVNVPARRFRIDTATQTFRLLTSESPGVGVELIRGKWIVTTRATTDVARSGLMRTAARNCLMKSAALTNWASYGAKFGIPLSIVYYDDERGENVKENAEEVARNIGNDIAAAVPDKIKVEVVEAGRMGDSSPLHGGIVAYSNNENSKLVLGGTLTSDSAGVQGAGSSHALGTVHADAKWSAIAADGEDAQETFYSYVAKAFATFNGLPVTTKPPRLKIQIARDMDPSTRASVADVMLNKLGIPISVNQMRSDTGYAEPESAADTAAGAPKPEPPPGFGGDEGEEEENEVPDADA